MYRLKASEKNLKSGLCALARLHFIVLSIYFAFKIVRRILLSSGDYGEAKRNQIKRLHHTEVSNRLSKVSHVHTTLFS